MHPYGSQGLNRERKKKYDMIREKILQVGQYSFLRKEKKNDCQLKSQLETNKLHFDKNLQSFISAMRH